MGIAVDLIARGQSQGVGVVIPERASVPEEVFRELSKRRIQVHIEEENLD